MANICLYKIKVKGTQRACYALVDMMPLYSWEKEYISEEGTEDDFELVFLGACKWSTSAYTSAMKDPKPFTKEELEAVQDGDHWDKTMKDKSILLNCEIFCNSKDIDDSCWAIYEHYDRGKEIHDECPPELHIKRGRDYDEAPIVYAASGSPAAYEPPKEKCKVKFESGSYWYTGDYEVGDIVYVEGAKSGCVGRVTVSVKDGSGEAAFYPIINKVGHADEFVEADIEALWASMKPKDRKEYLVKIGLEEKTTKKKFISVMDYQWTKFALNENDWSKFLMAMTYPSGKIV